MRRWGLVAVLLVSCSGGGGANGGDAGVADAGPAPPFADFQWMLRCAAMGGCAGYPMRDMRAFNGQEGALVSCSLTPSGGGQMLNFSISQEGHGIALVNASIIGDRFIGGSTCGVRVTEPGEEYAGRCGTSPPSVAQPCQFSDFTINETVASITAKLQCASLPRVGATTVLRELEGWPGVRAFPFEIRNCIGL